MRRFSPKAIGDAIQIVASIGMLAGLVLLIVEVAERQPPAPVARAIPPGAATPTVHLAAVAESRQRELEAFVHGNCSLCHGKEGSLGPFLSAANLQHLSENGISLTILHGRLNKGMPAWESQLSAADAHWIAGYLKRDGFTR